MTRKDLDDLDIMIRRRSNHYLASVPQLRLYGAGSSLSAAVEAVEAKKQDLVAELTAAGALDQIEIVPVAPSVEPMRILPSLVLFGAKGAIVLLLIIVAVGYTRASIKTEIDKVQAARIGGPVFWNSLQAGLDKAAEPTSDLSEAKKQVFLADIHILVDRWRPFVKEINRLFADHD